MRTYLITATRKNTTGIYGKPTERSGNDGRLYSVRGFTIIRLLCWYWDVSALVMDGEKMKTLDEVIKALELCTDWDAECKGCPYRDDNKGGLECEMRNLEEVLHYLRELKLFRQTPLMQGIHKAQREFALYHVDDWGEDEPEQNDSLTWGQLKQVDEKPVWIEVKNGERKWVLTWNDPDHADRIIITDAYGLRGPLNKSMYLKGEIQAYRKEHHDNS